MSNVGFEILRLALTGSDIADAEVRFGSGLNVVTGPSDTGKTFILQCIDFMCGASTLPPNIPEAAPYNAVEMQIRARRDSREYTLRRGLTGGAFVLSEEGEGDKNLSYQHQAGNENTLSHFLLELTGLTGKVVRKNQQGVTRSLSFRDLAHLTMISESDVIRNASPVFTGQVIHKTVEKSIFRLVLSGQDDAGIEAVEALQVSRARVDAQVEILLRLMERIQEAFNGLRVDADLASLQEQLDRIETEYQDVSNQLAEAEESVAAKEEQRRRSWQELRRVQSRLDVLSGLAERFELLAQQYRSDLRRLEAIAEAGTRLGELFEERCPVCGALPEHHDDDHRGSTENLATIAEACASEAKKVRALMSDLAVTQQDVAEEAAQLQVSQGELQETIEAIRAEINEQLRPRTHEMVQRGRVCQEQREQIRRGVEQLQRLDELKSMLDSLTGAEAPTPASPASRDTPVAAIERFCREVERRLRAWQFPEVGRVTFDLTEWDVIIGKRGRTSHGKGVRAVTHAAFTLGVLSHCMQQELPHPGLVVIDSPLVVYRAPDTDEEGFSQDVKGSFFRDIAASLGQSQIIILENEDVPADVADDQGVTVIRFTGTSVDRWGFLPRE